MNDQSPQRYRGSLLERAAALYPIAPPPIVEERAARRAAADAMFAIRKSRAHASEAATVVERHGSRNTRGFVSDRNPRRRVSARGPANVRANQLELDL